MNSNYLTDFIASAPSFKTKTVDGKATYLPKLVRERIYVLDSLIEEGEVNLDDFREALSSDLVEDALVELILADKSKLGTKTNQLLFAASCDRAMLSNERVEQKFLKKSVDISGNVLDESVFEKLAKDLEDFNLNKVCQSLLLPLASRLASAEVSEREGLLLQELDKILDPEVDLDVDMDMKKRVGKAVQRLKDEVKDKDSDVSLMISQLITGTRLTKQLEALSAKYGCNGDIVKFRDELDSTLASLAHSSPSFQIKVDDVNFVDNCIFFNKEFTEKGDSPIRKKSILINGEVKQPLEEEGLILGSDISDQDDLAFLDEQLYKKQLREAEVAFLNKGYEVVPVFSLRQKIAGYFKSRSLDDAKEVSIQDKKGNVLMTHSGTKSGETYTRIPNDQLSNPDVLEFAALKAKEAGVSPVYIHPPRSKSVSKAEKKEFVYNATKALLRIGYQPEEIDLGGIVNSRSVKQGLALAIKEFDESLRAKEGGLSAEGEDNGFGRKLRESIDSQKECSDENLVNVARQRPKTGFKP
ncbi:hypothetical protein [Vibrio sp. D431a]|uniref:hypothetical protein n=1 Tax=Vibrio sp. D431a TaxID=2837388 RepID=UPI0025572985|nr:hypothetical protein [Vibrio sp. D431a]MDK9793283.1 hypothetical protein [Vibrio sp. D431a]